MYSSFVYPSGLRLNMDTLQVKRSKLCQNHPQRSPHMTKPCSRDMSFSCMTAPANLSNVNSVRGHLFAKVGHQIDNIPPTSEALLQHTWRAVYQGGYIWGQAEVSVPKLPNPADWGWQFVNSAWKPFWSALDEASKTCRQL